MKKKVLVFISLMIATVFVYSYSDSEKAGLNALLLANVEALADGEYDDTTRCWGDGSVDCPYVAAKVEYVFGGYSLTELY